jgi:hypothetical protein
MPRIHLTHDFLNANKLYFIQEKFYSQKKKKLSLSLQIPT